jgi:tetratricopeptide (TPR) repeat protein
MHSGGLSKFLFFLFNWLSQNDEQVINARLLSSILACLLLAHAVLARVDQDSLKVYKEAQKYYAASDYTAAKATLIPLIAADEKNDITPYALFYYALSAYHHGELDLAEKTFMTIVEEHPDWEQKNEVFYWLGQLGFEARDYSAGLDRLAGIIEKTLEVPVERMKVHFLRLLDDICFLQTLFKQYPKDRAIARVLFEKVTRQPLISRDFDLFDTLARDFNFRLEKQNVLKEVVSLQKDSYNVGVFLPFFVDEVDYEEESSNLFVIELYQGIKVAVKELADQGIEINLLAYDTKKDPVTTAGLLAQEEVKGMDLIIGPLYAATIPLVAEFARAHQINLFNPLSENTDVVGDNPFTFLFKSSLETQAKKAAEFTLKHCKKELNVGIIYGTSKADAIQAHTYKQHIERNMGGAVTFMIPITPEEVQTFLNARRKDSRDSIGTTQEEITTTGLPSLDGLTHIYVASKDELIVASLLSNVERLKHPLCVIGHEAWLRQSSLTFEQLKKLHLCFVSPDYIDHEKEGIHRFRDNFYEHFAHYPTIYACLGYEMMLFLGHMLAQNGVYFQKYWNKQSYQGVLFEGVTYGVHHDNQHVPIVRFQKNRFVICNKEVLHDPET